MSTTTARRPARTYTTGPVVRTLRILGVLAALAVTGWILLRFPGLPETLPTHFDAAGNPDGWGSRVSVLLLAGVMLLLTTGIAAISTRPRAFNYPLEVTEANAQTVYREGERTMVWTLIGLDAVYLGAALAVITGGGAAVIGGGIAMLLGAVVVGIVRLVRGAR